MLIVVSLVKTISLNIWKRPLSLNLHLRFLSVAQKLRLLLSKSLRALYKKYSTELCNKVVKNVQHNQHLNGYTKAATDGRFLSHT